MAGPLAVGAVPARRSRATDRSTRCSKRVGVYGPADKTDVARVTDNPLWKTLSSVKNGTAVTVSDETWYLGLGVVAADRILTDLEKHLLG